MSDQEKWDEGLITDRTDNNLETCYCIGPQDGDKLCPCDMRKKRDAFEEEWNAMSQVDKERYLSGTWKIGAMV